ncbi:Lipocalin-like domain-containing protein [Hymenobacter gelipurpurascens]|uniref:Lipocalin-like domain-containing protein n=1 Tax=Hymenobacter gelipurpurascens TaxID=89968 RepID=A0A212T5C1_9BACT|nr:lipocalin-like domain-containing protein [Hymenobacter gelipurpurascens]SNC60954.1 Lipocalin-like domain-containing protein [Hymenobacter gelipurpurascens]
MRTVLGFVAVALSLVSCNSDAARKAADSRDTPIVGTWQLITGTVIDKGDTIITDYTRNKNISFVKIINDTHFAFLQHDVHKGKDSAVYVSGGGRYSLKDSTYSEHLEYCSARNWEGNDFAFTVSIKNDTLVQQGVEKVEASGINRINIEKYVKVN